MPGRIGKTFPVVPFIPSSLRAQAHIRQSLSVDVGVASSEGFGAPVITGGYPAFYLQTCGYSNASGTVPITSAPMPPAARTTLFLIAVARGNSLISGVTDTQGNTWVKDIERAGGGGTAAIWRCSSYTTALTTADTVTATGSAGPDVRVIEVFGVVATPLDVEVFGDTDIFPPTGSVSVSSPTLTRAVEFLLSVGANDGPTITTTYSATGTPTWNKVPDLPSWMGGVAWGVSASTTGDNVNWSYATSVTVGHAATVIAAYFIKAIITPMGISSGGVLGTPTVTGTGPQTVSPSGITSVQAFGTAVVSTGPQFVSPSGIASAQAFGSARISHVISPTGIASVSAFGTASLLVGLDVAPTGIASSQTFGSPSVKRGFKLSPTGIVSVQKFGKAKVQRHRTGSKVITPTGIASSSTFGTAVITTGVVFVYPTGIPGAEAFGLEDALGHPFIIPTPTGTAALPFMIIRRSGLRH